MIENGVQPNAHSFSAVINACAKAGDVITATQYLAQMQQAGVSADVVVFSSVLDACAKAGNTDRAKQVFQQMRASGIQPNVVSYAAFARPFAHRGDWAKVEQLKKDMITDGLSMNAYFLYALLLAYASARPRQADRAEAAFREACTQEVEVNKHVVTVLARAVGRSRCQQLMQESQHGKDTGDIKLHRQRKSHINSLSREQ